MKLLQYKGVKSAAFLVVIKSILEVLVSYALVLVVVSDLTLLIRNVILILLLYVLHGLFLYLSMEAIAKASANLKETLGQEIDSSFTNMSFTLYHQNNYGEHLSRYINDVPKIIELVLNKYMSRLGMLTVAISSFVALLSIHYTMGIIAIIASLVMIFVPNLFQNKLSTYIVGAQNAKAVYTSEMRELLQGFTMFFESRSFPLFLKKSYQSVKKYAHYVYKTERFAAVMSAVLTLVNSLVSLFALAVLAYLVTQNKVSAGSLLAVTSLIPSFGSSVMEYLSESEFYKSGLNLFEEKFSDAKGWTELQEIDVLTKGIQDSNKEQINKIELNDICVEYDRPLLFSNRNFLRGKKYAIMGESGSGKSTLLKVLLGEIDQYKGDVLINGKPKDKTSNLFDKIAYVNQETFLLNDTVKNNIDLDSKMTDDEIAILLEKLGLSNFDAQMKIEENGKNLSGGQRQRLALARALARGKDILVLDEATANLDEQTTRLIYDIVLANEATVIMITHHLDSETAKRFDEIIKL